MKMLITEMFYSSDDVSEFAWVRNEWYYCISTNMDFGLLRNMLDLRHIIDKKVLPSSSLGIFVSGLDDVLSKAMPVSVRILVGD